MNLEQKEANLNAKSDQLYVVIKKLNNERKYVYFIASP